MQPQQPADHGGHLLLHLPRSQYVVKLETSSAHTSKCLALLKGDTRSQSVPVVSNQLRKLEHNLLSGHYARRTPCWKCLLSTLHRSLELRISVLRHTGYQVICGGVVEVDELSGLRLDELIINKVWRVLHVLDLLVCRWVVVSTECQSCSRLQMLSGGMQPTSSDLGGLSRGRH